MEDQEIDHATTTDDAGRIQTGVLVGSDLGDGAAVTLARLLDDREMRSILDTINNHQGIYVHSGVARCLGCNSMALTNDPNSASTFRHGDGCPYAQLGRMMRQLAVQPTTAPPWIPLELFGEWCQYDAEMPIPAYRREGNRVYLRGAVSCDPHANVTPIAELPEGYRPFQKFPSERNAYMASVTDDGLILPPELFGRMVVTLDGMAFLTWEGKPDGR